MLITEHVAADQWHSRLQQLQQAGYRWFGWLAAIDEVGRSDELRVVAQLRGDDTVSVDTTVNRTAGQLASLADLWPGAAWYEREATRDFGITFDSTTIGPGWLLKDTVPAARAVADWPGADGPDAGTARRRATPAGVPDPAHWGRRTPEQGPAEASERLPDSGGRRRRRR